MRFLNLAVYDRKSGSETRDEGVSIRQVGDLSRIGTAEP